jgi:hypothetical protein
MLVQPHPVFSRLDSREDASANKVESPDGNKSRLGSVSYKALKSVVPRAV